ncbi:MAG: response regulator, partial [Ignavibacteria bacterium]|nr:response regulator [Ignavibacteria bacterium]
EKGSTFSILIPLLSEIPLEKEMPEPVMINKVSKSALKALDENLSILLVEDNPLNIEVVERFLSKTGKVTPVRDGETAVLAAQKDLFDLLLVDISLGHGIDGIEVLKRIRLMENYTNVPAIALTGYISETNRRRFQAAGFNGYLGKPFEKKDLLNYISKMFS